MQKLKTDHKIRTTLRGRNLADIREFLNEFPAEIVEKNPELVICYGGDGTLLGAERDFPEVPKLPLRDSRSNPQCPVHGEEKLLAEFFSGKLARQQLIKLEALTDNGLKLNALNDIIISKKIISSAVRYRLWLDGKPYGHQIVGDGLVISTPFGSTGYYRSITHGFFRLGIGLAFNNTTEPIDHLVISDETEILVEMIRGPAVLLADNDPELLPLEKGHLVSVHKTDKTITVYGIDEFRCGDCFNLRQKNGNPV